VRGNGAKAHFFGADTANRRTAQRRFLDVTSAHAHFDARNCGGGLAADL